MLHSLVDDGKPDPVVRDGIEQIIPGYYNALTVGRDAGSDVVQIGFNSQDPELAAAVPNALLGIYLDQRKASAQGHLASAEEWLRQRIAEQQGRVDAASDAVASYRKAVGTVSNDVQAEQIKSAAELTDRLAEIQQSRTEVAYKINDLLIPETLAQT
jgi:uncharacterized protein involved in exopolysaccharide biosynthesis